VAALIGAGCQRKHAGPQQVNDLLRAGAGQHWLAGTQAGECLVSLGEMLSRPDDLRPARDAIRLYCPVGLANTEVAPLPARLGR
jgi:hypothetical protein